MNYIVSKHTSKAYNYHPKTKDELKELVNKLIDKRGLKAYLNDIDTSAITDMSGMFSFSQFDGDISKWNVSNVKLMNGMFKDSPLQNNTPAWYH